MTTTSSTLRQQYGKFKASFNTVVHIFSSENNAGPGPLENLLVSVDRVRSPSPGLCSSPGRCLTVTTCDVRRYEGCGSRVA
jgi:hypothetical protein